MLYFLYILLGGITVTFVKGELTLELLTLEDDLDTDPSASKGKSRRKRKTQKSASDSFKGLLEWTIAWMP